MCYVCTAKYKGCHIQQNAIDAAGQPTYERTPQTTYSCVNNIDRHCSYDVHVLSIREVNGDKTSWNNALNTGNISVDLSVNGEGNRPLVLVLLSHYPVNWMLHIPSDVMIEKVLQVSIACFGT